ncbi:hypothetical protein ACIQWB_32050 [Streptomyces olivaceus]|uniref:hypothetical protein n=1 Tax=Streptomyces olivaceus TaxID=47716 RepID=UPI003820DB2C
MTWFFLVDELVLCPFWRPGRGRWLPSVGNFAGVSAEDVVFGVVVADVVAEVLLCVEVLVVLGEIVVFPLSAVIRRWDARGALGVGEAESSSRCLSSRWLWSSWPL